MPGDRWFIYRTVVFCETEEQADQVMAERLGVDEDYGFDYTVEYEYQGMAEIVPDREATGGES